MLARHAARRGGPPSAAKHAHPRDRPSSRRRSPPRPSRSRCRRCASASRGLPGRSASRRQRRRRRREHDRAFRSRATTGRGHRRDRSPTLERRRRLPLSRSDARPPHPRAAASSREHSADEIRALPLHGHPTTARRPSSRPSQWSAGRVVIDAEFKTLDVIRPRDRAGAGVRRRRVGVLPGRRRPRVLRRSARGRPRCRAARRAAGTRRRRDARAAARGERRSAAGDRAAPELLDRDTARPHPPRREAHLDQRVVPRGERTRGIWPLRRKAACTAVFERGITIAVTKVPEDCMRQRDAFVRLHPESSADAVRMHYPMRPEARGATR